MKSKIKLPIALLLSVALVIACKKDKVAAPALVPPGAVQRGSLSLTFTINVANCSSVAYNPVKNVYYIVRAGAGSYPFQTLSSSGGQLSQNLSAGDVHGMWWNKNTNSLEVNLYAAGGWGKPTLSDEGYATAGYTILFTGQHQPDTQSIGTFDYNNNKVIFYKAGTTAYIYDRTTGEQTSTLELTGINLATINSNTIIYTGVSGYELGLLDYQVKRILFFNGNTGAFTAATQLPAATVTSPEFNFSYANGFAWTFDPATETWSSFKIF